MFFNIHNVNLAYLSVLHLQFLKKIVRTTRYCFISFNMIFHSFKHSQGPEESVENRGRSPRFSTFPMDLANVNE